MAGKIVFSIETQMEMDGRQLKAIKPNKDGVYTGIPLAVVGMASRNGVNYERESVLQCLTDMKQKFASSIATGDLEGEWCHPFLHGEKSIERLLRIERTLVSHCFTKIYGVEDGGVLLIYGDVKPFGPYGKYLKESFEDPARNTSFSLRSACVKTGVKDGITQKRMLAMVTFDAVDGPGFLQCSKRFRDPAVSTESFAPSLCEDLSKYDGEIECGREEYLALCAEYEDAGMESMVINNQKILDALGCDKLTVRNKVIGRRARLGRTTFTDGEKPVSLFEQCFKI